MCGENIMKEILLPFNVFEKYLTDKNMYTVKIS